MLLLVLGLVGTSAGESSHSAFSKYTPFLSDEFVNWIASETSLHFSLAFSSHCILKAVSEQALLSYCSAYEYFLPVTREDPHLRCLECNICEGAWSCAGSCAIEDLRPGLQPG